MKYAWTAYQEDITREVESQSHVVKEPTASVVCFLF